MTAYKTTLAPEAQKPEPVLAVAHHRYHHLRSLAVAIRSILSQTIAALNLHRKLNRFTLKLIQLYGGI